VVDLVACLHIDEAARQPDAGPLGWVKRHCHTSGPWCWILARPRPIRPVKVRGNLGLWDIETKLIQPLSPRRAQRKRSRRP